ncbi:hypothetical protein [Halomonas sp. GD1P12]|uniref:hypothetical protein n=1 Tax=Halomonas sp. GD1P12 TaxID=2982691 RepID=UPI0021E39EA8|nr:hypothetical protein [Halomonas sp. GD1P12]UYG00215.1 hypothetical protein OCT39_01285 [Halomonas sp. GD1P12]
MTSTGTKIKTLALAMGLAIGLSGCGEDLSDRPYVMSCTIKDQPYSARNEGDAARSDHTFDLYSGGLNLPDNDEITRRGGRSGDYFYRGVLTDEEGALQSNRVLTQPIINRSGLMFRLERSGQLLAPADRQRGERGPRVAMNPEGWADIEHFTLNTNGELTPVEFQLTSLQTENQGRTERKRHANIGARLPHDARYVIVKYTFRDIASTWVDSDKTLETWWAYPLYERHRWAPKDWEEAQRRPDAFSHYVQFISRYNQGMGAHYPAVDRHDRDNLRALYPEPVSVGRFEQRGAPCLAGTHANFRNYVSLFGNIGEHNTVVLNETAGFRFVGYDEADALALPDSLRDYEPDVERNKYNEIVKRL